jgi:hypothetical protein
MTTQLIACTSFPVGANLFARHRTPGHLRRDDNHPSLNLRGLTLQGLSHLLNGLIAHGQANKFAPTTAEWPSGKPGDTPQFLPLSNSGSLPVTAPDCRRN